MFRSIEIFNFRLHGYETPPGWNPVQVDILFLSCVLGRWVRHIENVVPEIGPFFDLMVTSDMSKNFTAQQALQEIQIIRSQLSSSQLNSLVINRYWNDGIVEMKLRCPTK